MTKINPYKVITYTVAALLLTGTLYLAYLGSGVAMDRFAESRFKDMTIKKANCIAKVEGMMEGLRLE